MLKIVVGPYDECFIAKLEGQGEGWESKSAAGDNAEEAVGRLVFEYPGLFSAAGITVEKKS